MRQYKINKEICNLMNKSRNYTYKSIIRKYYNDVE